MQFLIDSYKKTGQLHHVYILEGEKESTREKLYHFLENELEEKVKGNPDLWHTRHETLTIDDARELRDTQANKAISTGRKLFIIETRFMTIEAQNALLKVFEEPTPNTYFFIITPTAEVFLPTLKSRVVRIAVEGNENDAQELAQDFLKNSYKKRLETVAGIVEEKDKGQAIELINALLVELHDKKQKDTQVMQELLTTRNYLNDRSPSLKLLLEHIALIVPVLK